MPLPHPPSSNSLIRLSLSLSLVLVILAGAAPLPAQAASTTVVISEFRVRGPNGGSDEFIELYNLSTSPVSIGGWKVKGSNSAGSVSTRATITAGTMLNPGCHYLLTNSSTSGGPYSGSVPGNQTYATGITDDGGIALTLPDDTIVDQVGMSAGSAFKEGTPLASLGSSNLNRGYERKPGGMAGSGTDTDDNSGDFQLITPSDPQNLSSLCNGGESAPAVSSTTPGSGAVNVAVDANLTINFSEPVNVTGSWFTLSCASSDGHTAAVSGGPTTFTLDPDADFANSETCTATVAAGQVTDQDADDPPDNMAADYSWSFTIVAPPVHIHDIQGASQRSPLAGLAVSNVAGIVTAKRTNGFYMQDPSPDSDPATSEGIFVFTSSAPPVNVGDAVLVGGTVTEFRAGGSSSTNLTITEIGSPSIVVTSSGNPLPAPTIIGSGGRIPPTDVIEDDATGDVETSGVFDPDTDGIDFYESLEAMRVQVNDAVAVGPTVVFGTLSQNREIPVVGDNGANAGVRTPRGGIIIRPSDFNPERIILNDLIAGGPILPSVNVGDSFPGAVVGVMDYSFGNFKLEVTLLPAAASGGLTQEATTPAGTNELAVATFNVENLSPADLQSKFDELAHLIVDHLRSPDIIAVEEIQDDNGAVNDSVVDATTTYNALIAAIQMAGGPTYDFRQINPVDDQDGGQPGGNIRQGFLFRTDRGLSFIDRPGGDSTTATTVLPGPQLSFSPGRIDPTNGAFTTSRKPLAAEFMFNGHHLFVIANHFNSKGGDQPLFGHFQPPTRISEVQRHQQAQIVNDFVGAILAVDSNADIIVLGDLNDFEFSDTANILKGAVLHDLMDTLPQEERYSYVFEGNSQTLDHILLSSDLFSARPFSYDVVHVNSEFAAQASDHEPQVVHILLNDAPTAGAGGPYSVDEGGSVVVTASGSDPEGGPLTFEWDLDDDGSFETPGQSVTFSAAALDGPSSHMIGVRATDDGGLSATAQATVNVQNVPPSVGTPGFSAEPSTEGSPVTASATFGDPGPNDAPFTCAVNYGDGSGDLPGTVGGSTCAGPAHTYALFGSYLVTISVTDKDGGTGSNSATHSVIYNFSGFFSPVDNLPTMNVAKAGSAIPVKFSLGGDRGLNIFAAGYPKSQEIECDSTAPVNGIDETLSAGASGLTYDASTDQYTYVWKTDKAWASTCRQLVVKLSDGTYHRANFRFNK